VSTKAIIHTHTLGVHSVGIGRLRKCRGSGCWEKLEILRLPALILLALYLDLGGAD